MENDIFENDINIVLLGDNKVGKSSLIMSYATRRFNPDYVPRVLDAYRVVVPVMQKQLRLVIWDTNGNIDDESAKGLGKFAMHNSQVALLCFQVSNSDSFQSIKKHWLPLVKNAKKTPQKILVALKTDERQNPSLRVFREREGKHMVSYEEAQEFSRKEGFKTYVECCSLTGQNVNLVFKMAIITNIAPKVPQKLKKAPPPEEKQKPDEAPAPVHKKKCQIF